MTIPDSLPVLLGWTLLHFIWEGTAIAILVAGGLWLLRDREASSRYVLACGGLIAMVAAPLITGLVLLESGVVADSTIASAAAIPLISRSSSVTSAPVPAIESALAILATLWLAGTSCFQLRLLLNWWRAERLRRAAVEPLPRPWQPIVAELVERVGVRRRVRVVRSMLVRVPTVVGWLRPVVLVPATALTGLSREQLRAVLAHELAHVRRHDYIVNVLQSIAEALLFYHPLVWWLSGRIRVEREYCCDDIAVAVGGNALQYARALSTLDEWRASVTTPALAATGEPLMNRICRLVGVRSSSSGRLRPATPAAVIVSVVAMGALAATAAVRHQHDPPASMHEVGDLAWVDLVAVAEALEIEDAETFAVLRELGLDDTTLLNVMRAFGVGDEVVEVVHRMADERSRLERRVRVRFDELHLQHAEGTIGAEEFKRRSKQLHEGAIARFKDVQREIVREHRQEDDPIAAMAERLHGRFAELDKAETGLDQAAAELAAAFESGSIDQAAAVEQRARLEMRRAEIAAAREKLERHMHQARDRIAHLRDAGLSDEQVHERLIAELKQRRPDAANADEMHRKLLGRWKELEMHAHARRAQIEHELENGELTEAEAARQLERLQAELEHGRAQHETALADAKARKARIDALRAEGLSPEQIEQRLAIRHRQDPPKAERHADADRDRLTALHARAKAAHQRIKATLEAGDITPEEAEARIAGLEREVHAAMRSIEEGRLRQRREHDAAGDRSAADAARVEHLRSRLVEARRRLEAGVKEGTVSAEDAATRSEALDHLEQELKRRLERAQPRR